MAKLDFRARAARIRELIASEKRPAFDPGEINELAFPGGLDRQVDRLMAENDEAIELAIQFLEADPWFFRSGYIKETFLRRLRYAALTEAQRARLRDVLLRIVDSRGGREFREYCKLAKVLQTGELREKLETRTGSDDETVAQRARSMLAYLDR